MANGVETSAEEWRSHGEWARGHGDHERAFGAWAGQSAAQQGEGRSPWVAERLGTAPADKLTAIAERANARAQGWDDHHEKAIAAANSYTHAEESSAAGLLRATADTGGATRPAGSGFGGGTPLNGGASSTTTTLQHGGTEALPKYDAQGRRILTPAGPRKFDGQASVDAPKKQ